MKFLYALRREVFALHARAPLNFRAPAPLPATALEQRGRASVSRHGQGCGEGCGCVLDIQVPTTVVLQHTKYSTCARIEFC